MVTVVFDLIILLISKMRDDEFNYINITKH
jgi:hypothetical protein